MNSQSKEYAGLTVTVIGWNPDLYMDWFCDKHEYAFPMKAKVSTKKNNKGDTLIEMPERIFERLDPIRYWNKNWFIYKSTKNENTIRLQKTTPAGNKQP